MAKPTKTSPVALVPPAKPHTAPTDVRKITPEQVKDISEAHAAMVSRRADLGVAHILAIHAKKAYEDALETEAKITADAEKIEAGFLATLGEAAKSVGISPTESAQWECALGESCFKRKS
jgi:hypothetical protein